MSNTMPDYREYKEGEAVWYCRPPDRTGCWGNTPPTEFPPLSATILKTSGGLYPSRYMIKYDCCITWVNGNLIKPLSIRNVMVKGFDLE